MKTFLNNNCQNIKLFLFSKIIPLSSSSSLASFNQVNFDVKLKQASLLPPCARQYTNLYLSFLNKYIKKLVRCPHAVVSSFRCSFFLQKLLNARTTERAKIYTQFVMSWFFFFLLRFSRFYIEQYFFLIKKKFSAHVAFTLNNCCCVSPSSTLTHSMWLDGLLALISIKIY